MKNYVQKHFYDKIFLFAKTFRCDYAVFLDQTNHIFSSCISAVKNIALTLGTAEH